MKALVGKYGTGNELTGRKRHHLVPGRRKVSIRARSQYPRIENPLRVMRVPIMFLLRQLGLIPNLLHSHRGHEIRVSLIRLVDFNLLQLALRVVAAAEVLGLGEDLDHGGQGGDGDVLGVEMDKVLAEAGEVV